MHELKATRVQTLTTREMAQIGLFTALIAAGAYIKVNIPVQPFYYAVFICSFSWIFTWGEKRRYLCRNLPGSRTFRYSGICSRWRSGIFDPSNLWFFAGFCICSMDHRKIILSSSGSRYCLGSVQCLLGNDGLLCFRNGVFLRDQ